jgi:hypothetical protein
MYEQLDQFYYINDIFHLNIEKLNNLLFDNYMEIIFKYFIDSLTYIPNQHQVTPMVKIVQRQTMNTPNFIPMKKENYECIIPKKFTEQSEQEEEDEDEEEEGKEIEKKKQETSEQEEKNSVEQVTSEQEKNPFEDSSENVENQEEKNPFEQEEDMNPFESVEKTIETFNTEKNETLSETGTPNEENVTEEETVNPNEEENVTDEVEEENEKPTLPPLEIEDVRNEVIEEKTPPTTPKKTHLNPVETEYLSHKLSLYLLSHSIQTFDHQMLVDKIMKVILDESFLNLIHSQLRTGNDSLIYTGICLLNSLSNHKSNFIPKN